MQKSEEIKKSKIKNDNYIHIAGWMVNDLKLKGNSLLIYAIIYGFTQAENQVYSGSLQYLADWTCSTKQSVINCLKKMVEDGLLEKKDKLVNGVKFCEYRTTKFNGYSTKFNDGIQQSLIGIQQSLPNNINNNIDNNKKNIKKERKKETSYDEIINSKIDNDEIKDLIYEFIKMRNLKKKPLTDRALTIQINKLYKLSSDAEEQKQIIEKTIVKNWDEFYGLRKEYNHDQHAKSDVDLSKYDR